MSKEAAQEAYVNKLVEVRHHISVAGIAVRAKRIYRCSQQRTRKSRRSTSRTSMLRKRDLGESSNNSRSWGTDGLVSLYCASLRCFFATKRCVLLVSYHASFGYRSFVLGPSSHLKRLSANGGRAMKVLGGKEPEWNCNEKPFSWASSPVCGVGRLR
jgi:hypothetical protein